MLTMRAIYHHSTPSGRTAQEVEPEGKAAEEIAALWTWISEQVNMGARSRVNKKGRAA
jgi:chromosome partitioning protein